MVSSVSNGPSSVSNYPATTNDAPASSAGAAPESSANGSGKISYDNYNGPSAQKAPEEASSLSSGEKLKEMDGMISRIKDMFSKGEGAEGKDDKTAAADELGKGKKTEDADKKEDADELGKDKKTEGVDKKDDADELGKDKAADDADKTDEASDKDLKSKAMDVLKNVVDAITNLFVTKEPTSAAPK